MRIVLSYCAQPRLSCVTMAVVWPCVTVAVAWPCEPTTQIGTNDINVQGQFPAKAFEAVQLWSSTAPSRICTAVVWFCWSDGMVAPFGLVDEAGAPKPAYYSYQNATRSI